jgi:DNA polymerase III subunit gamma/tau
MAAVPYQSLYRQYRPQRFGEVRGQQHITTALRNAVRAGRPGHAYLFSGPRGTGKTSTAGLLAKALNCTALDDGEPCGKCESCVSVQTGQSLDVFELDAASNNRVEEMRDLVARAALGSPGRWKVYIVDEVHMLSTAASNALLKTLEEPPGHVVFVLATTDPQKVLPTIKSRTQHFEFHLLPAEVLGGLLRDVNADAALGLDDSVLDQVMRKGRGSARDALSALDQVAAAGHAEEELETPGQITEALIERDAGRALLAVAAACGAGRDPRRIAVEVIERLRRCFLAVMATDAADVPLDELPALQDEARRLGTPAVVRAIEVLGDALITMRDALDTRVTLEVALVRLCAPEADTSIEAVVERLERLERRVGAVGTPPPMHDPPPPPRSPTDSPETRASLGAFRRPAERESEPAPPTASASPSAGASPSASAATAPEATLPTRDEITTAWGDRLLASLPPGSRSVYRTGRWLRVEDGRAVFAVPNAFHLERAEAKRRDVEEALSAHFGVRVAVAVVEDDGGVAPAPDAPPPPDDDTDLTAVDLAALDVAADAPSSAADRLKAAFPGAEEVST